MNTEIDTVSTQLVTANQQIKTLKDEKDMLSRKLLQLKKENTQPQNVVSKFETEMLRHKNEQLEREKKQLHSKVTNLMQASESSQCEIENLKSMMKSTEDKLCETRDETKKSNERLIREIQILTDEKDSLSNYLKKMHHMNEALISEKKLLENRLERQLQKEKEMSRDTESHYRPQNATLIQNHKDLQVLVNEKHKLISQNTELTAMNEDLQSKNDELTKEVKLKSRILRQTKQNSASDMNDLISQKNMIERERNALKEKILRLKVQLKDAQGQHDSVQPQIQALSEEKQDLLRHVSVFRSNPSLEESKQVAMCKNEKRLGLEEELSKGTETMELLASLVSRLENLTTKKTLTYESMVGPTFVSEELETNKEEIATEKSSKFSENNPCTSNSNLNSSIKTNKKTFSEQIIVIPKGHRDDHLTRTNISQNKLSQSNVATSSKKRHTLSSELSVTITDERGISMENRRKSSTCEQANDFPIFNEKSSQGHRKYGEELDYGKSSITGRISTNEKSVENCQQHEDKEDGVQCKMRKKRYRDRKFRPVSLPGITTEDLISTVKQLSGKKL